MPKIRAFEEQWLAYCFRQGICETVSEIQACPVPSFSEIAIRFTRNLSLLGGYVLDNQFGFTTKIVEPTACYRAAPGVNYNGRLDVIDRGDAARVGSIHGVGKCRSVGFSMVPPS